MSESVTVLGTAFESLWSVKGKGGRASWLRSLGVLSRLEKCGVHITDIGDLTWDCGRQASEDKEGYEEHLNSYRQFLAGVVTLELQRGHSPLLCIGGSSKTAMGTIQGCLKYNPKSRILWVQSHKTKDSLEWSFKCPPEFIGEQELVGDPKDLLVKIDPTACTPLVLCIDFQLILKNNLAEQGRQLINQVLQTKRLLALDLMNIKRFEKPEEDVEQMLERLFILIEGLNPSKEISQ